MGEVQVTGGSNLTVPAQIVLTVAVGLAGTAVATHEAVDIAPTATVAQSSSPSIGLLNATTASETLYANIEPLKIRTIASDSRWHHYVSKRLRELRDGKYDFTGFRAPSVQVIERAQFLANSFFAPEHPTPSVVPSEEGDVLYVWHKAGWDLEINVGLEEILVWAHDRRAGKDWHGAFEELRVPVAKLLDFLAWH
jgi:hypothetical protein